MKSSCFELITCKYTQHNQEQRIVLVQVQPDYGLGQVMLDIKQYIYIGFGKYTGVMYTYKTIFFSIYIGSM